MSVSGITQSHLTVYNTAQRLGKNGKDQIEQPDKAEAETIRESAVLVSLSEEAKAGAEEAKKKIQETQAAKEAISGQIESAGKQGDAVADAFNTLKKCLTIALRIMNGDNVPDEDSHYLMENNSALYLQAVMLRQQKENAKEHESVLTDEQKSSDVSAVSADFQASAPVAADSADEVTEPPSAEAGSSEKPPQN